MSRILPVHARRNERRFILDLPFVDHATKVPEEPKLLDAAHQTNGSYRIFYRCSSGTQSSALLFQNLLGLSSSVPRI
jgi:hypothetical protein